MCSNRTFSLKKFTRIINKTITFALTVSLLTGLLLSSPQKASAAASQFDMTFGSAGRVAVDLGDVFDAVQDTALQPDGKIVAVAYYADDFAVVRFNPDGSLDPTFGGDGIVTTDFGTNSLDRSMAVAIQPDGKIVAGGSARVSTGPNNIDFALIRYNPDGSLDTTFDGDGKVVTILPLSQRILDMAIQPDGRIVVVGSFEMNSNNDFDFAVARYNPDGSPDSTFGANGLATTSFGTSVDEAGSLALQPDGRIVVAGFTRSTQKNKFNFALARYNPDGSLDASFDGDGKLTTSSGFDERARAVLIQPDGKIVAGGNSSGLGSGGEFFSYFHLVRYNSDGSLDPAFDTDGKVFTDFGPLPASLASIALQADGKIVAGGDINAAFALARYNPNGSLDISFHGDGKLTALETAEMKLSGINSVVIEPNGKIVAAGQRDDNLALARFLGDPRGIFEFNQPIAPADRPIGGMPGVDPNGRYPSLLDVAGLTGGISKIRVNLKNLSHSRPTDFDILLESPAGLRTMLLSDAVSGSAVGNLDITLDQSAAADASTGVGHHGFYRPTNQAGDPALEPGGIDIFPSPGPGSANFGAADLNLFNRSNPDGAWKLWVADDENGAAGSIGGWSLDITVTTSRLNNLTSDFDGDGRADFAIFRPSSGEWWETSSFTGQSGVVQFGSGADVPVPADWTGDGKTDAAVFRPATGEWYVLRSEDYSYFCFRFGQTGDIAVPGDFDGDGRADAAVYRPADKTWYILQSSGGSRIEPFGAGGDLPVVSDYDGDGKSDIAIFRPSTGQWWINGSTNGPSVTGFGLATDKPVPGDYTGDGKSDIAVWRPATGEWYILRSEDGTVNSFPFGESNDLPAPGDFDGDGLCDATVFRPSTGIWFSETRTQGTMISVFGTNGDRPVAGVFVP